MVKDAPILAVLADSYSRKILSATWDKELSVLELSNQLNIPTATAYRKIKNLEDLGLIKLKKSLIKTSGNEEKFYRCTLKQAKIEFVNGKLSVRVDFVEMDSFVRLWKTLSGKEMKAYKEKKKSLENEP